MMLSNAHPNFQAKIRAIATVSGMDADAVYALWREYDRRCTMYDQSPVLIEFVDWYADALGGDIPNLEAATYAEPA